MDHSTEPGEITQAMRGLGLALKALARWPWSERRRQALITALNTVLELHVSGIMHQAAEIVTGPVGRMGRQQGRHERRLAEIEERLGRLESGDQSRAVGADDDGAV